MIGNRDIVKLEDGTYKCNQCGSIKSTYKSITSHYDHCGKNNRFYNKHFIKELNPFYGKHHTDKTKEILREKCSIANLGKVRSEESRERYRIANLGNTHGKDKKRTPEQCKHYSEGRRKYLKENGIPKNVGFRYKGSKFIKDNKEIFLRSSYEAIYLLWLEWKNEDYQYESLRLEYIDGEEIYNPDFYLPKYDRIVEVKGFLTDEIITKLYRCEETTYCHGYDWELILGGEIWDYYYELEDNGINVEYLYYTIIYWNKDDHNGEYPKWKYNKESEEIIFINE